VLVVADLEVRIVTEDGELRAGLEPSRDYQRQST
jgi:hypothetical protein